LEVEVKHRKTGLAVLSPIVAALVLLTAACTPPAGPTVITNVTTTVIVNGQSGTDPGEANKSKGSVLSETKKVTINGFVNGEKCPAGITPANENKKIRLGCDLAVTVNPRRADDSVIEDDKAPPVDYFAQATGQDVAKFTQSASNSYNGDVHTLKAGKFGLIASVVGIPSGLQEFEVIP
jgi:hypothetical protein